MATNIKIPDLKRIAEVQALLVKAMQFNRKGYAADILRGEMISAESLAAYVTVESIACALGWVLGDPTLEEYIQSITSKAAKL